MYLHCHNCGWSQDDWWEFKIHWDRLFRPSRWTAYCYPFGYNPISHICFEIVCWIMPKYIKTNEGRKHSWAIMFKEIKRHIKGAYNQEWWTRDSWLQEYNSCSVGCPECGKLSSLDED